MAKIETNIITNANIWVEGANLLGKADEVQSPVVKIKTVENKALGMIGTSVLPSGVEKLEAKIKFNSFYADAFNLIANPYKTVNIQVRGNIEKYSNNTKTGDDSVALFMAGMFDSIPLLGNIKSQEKVEFETSMQVNYAKLTVAGIELYEIDVINNIWNVAGKDMLLAYRINIGA